MIENTTEKYRITVDDYGVIEIYSLAPPQPVQREFTAVGWKEVPVDPAFAAVVAQMAKYPALRAAYLGDHKYEIDCDTGVQRWIGPKTKRQIIGYLRKCGLAANDTAKVIRASEQTTHDGVDRVCQ